MRRPGLIVTLCVVLAAALVIGIWLARSGVRAVVTDAPAPASPLQQARAPSTAPADTPAEAPAPEAVDLEIVRAALPDNRYWDDQAPTSDPAVLERRALQKESRNKEWGRIQSGSADTSEIDAYFAERERRSRDAIVFARFVLDHYGASLSEQERGLYTLAIAMNGTRIAALDHDKAEALTRKQRQDEVRTAWRSR